MIALWIVASIATILFLAGFMEPDKVEGYAKNKAMNSILYLIASALYIPNRLGAFLRRVLRGLKRA